MKGNTVETVSYCVTEISIDALWLSTRSYNILQSAKIETISDLILYTKEEFLQLKGCGKTTLNELRSHLSRLDLDFAPLSINGLSLREEKTLKCILDDRSKTKQKPLPKKEFNEKYLPATDLEDRAGALAFK